MGDISVRCFQAGWLENLEYILWNEVNSASGLNKGNCISRDDKKRLIGLANKSGAWIIWDENGRTAIPLKTWRARYDADIKRDPGLLDLR